VKYTGTKKDSTMK